jgi:putative photosynthetic complex assembly protein 2
VLEAGLAIGAVIALWWASTVLILYLDGLPRATFRVSIATGAAVAAAGFAGLALTAELATPAGAFAAFAAALAIWGFNELLFLTGAVTGPHRAPLEPGAEGWRRFSSAAGAILWHELALAASLLAVAALTAGAPNPVGFWTFLVLFVMRLSAKLNIFLGVPNSAAELLPKHLAYLESYFRARPMNALFPVSVTLATIALGHVATQAAGASGFVLSAHALLATLLALAILEHWLLVLPVPAAALWRWGLKSRAEPISGPPIARPENVIVHPAVRKLRG